jgi:hypothetical protein
MEHGGHGGHGGFGKVERLAPVEAWQVEVDTEEKKKE